MKIKIFNLINPMTEPYMGEMYSLEDKATAQEAGIFMSQILKRSNLVDKNGRVAPTCMGMDPGTVQAGVVIGSLVRKDSYCIGITFMRSADSDSSEFLLEMSVFLSEIQPLINLKAAAFEIQYDREASHREAIRVLRTATNTWKSRIARLGVDCFDAPVNAHRACLFEGTGISTRSVDKKTIVNQVKKQNPGFLMIKSVDTHEAYGILKYFYRDYYHAMHAKHATPKGVLTPMKLATKSKDATRDIRVNYTLSVVTPKALAADLITILLLYSMLFA